MLDVPATGGSSKIVESALFNLNLIKNRRELIQINIVEEIHFELLVCDEPKIPT